MSMEMKPIQYLLDMSSHAQYVKVLKSTCQPRTDIQYTIYDGVGNVSQAYIETLMEKMPQDWPDEAKVEVALARYRNELKQIDMM